MAYEELEGSYQAAPGSGGAYDRLLRSIEDEFEQLQRYQDQLHKANDHGTPKPSEVHAAYVGALPEQHGAVPLWWPRSHPLFAARVQPRMVQPALPTFGIKLEPSLGGPPAMPPVNRRWVCAPGSLPQLRRALSRELSTSRNICRGSAQKNSVS